MAIQLANKQNVTAPNATYPYGNIKDNPGDNSGTPLNMVVHADFHQFFAKLLAESGITPNNLPDNASNGFQYFQSMVNIANLYAGQNIVKAFGGYTTNELLILWGCEISATIPGSSTITAGAVFYNGICYAVPSATVITTGSQTLVFKIDTSVQPNFVYLTNGASGSGIANYNNVRYYNNNYKRNTDVILSHTVSGISPSAVSFSDVHAIKRNGMINLSGVIELVGVGGITAPEDFYIDMVVSQDYEYNGILPAISGNGAVVGLCNIVNVAGTSDNYANGFIRLTPSFTTTIRIIVVVGKTIPSGNIEICFSASYRGLTI